MGIQGTVLFETVALLYQASVEFLLALYLAQEFIIGGRDCGLQELVIIGNVGDKIAAVGFPIFHGLKVFIMGTDPPIQFHEGRWLEQGML